MLSQRTDQRDLQAPAKAVIAAGVVYLVLAIIWVISGLAALAFSFFCFARSGSALDKVVGTVLAVTLGPLYWLYLAANSNYCR